MQTPFTTDLPRPLSPASAWIQRWSHLVPPQGTVLDIACGSGRHMQWFAQRGHAVIGVDRAPEALQTAASFGATLLADIENGPWPLMQGDQVRRFDAVIVCHYLWRPLLALMVDSVAPGGVLIYETFSQGHETVGKPSRPDFLLRPGELLTICRDLHIVAFEEGFLEQPDRFMQRIVAIQPDSAPQASTAPARYAL